MSELKLCKDCKHSGWGYFDEGCLKTLTRNDDLYPSDKSWESTQDCSEAREDEELCGKEARWFEPREVK